MQNWHDRAKRLLRRIEGPALLVLCTNVIAQGVIASAVDLRAMYCLPLLNSSIRALEAFNGLSYAGQQEYQRLRYKFEKTENYLKIRVLALDSDNLDAMLLARQSGDKAVVRISEITQSCLTKFPADFGNSKWNDKFEGCKAAAGFTEVGLRECKDNSLLPY